ncbi:MAG: hypothetical protein CSA33_06420 [Desulfobulbus propionicus]|nr:MAG: hypothetical protein CSA33_06420 [Desulfobulbus propionicus]
MKTPVQPPFLVAGSIEKRFAGIKAVNGINLQLFSGELLAILGPSGCGKSTLLRIIAGLSRPDAGYVSCQGETWADERVFVNPEDRNCGMVFQDMALFPHLSIQDNIGFAIERRRKREVVSAMLDLVGLAGFGDRMVYQLSGGQQQRAALARSLAPGPALLLLDEPFSGLDLKLRQAMRREVRRIVKQQGVTAILVTHDQSEAFAFADTVAVMFAGKVEQHAAPQTIYHQPATHNIAAFVGDANFMSMEQALACFPGVAALRDDLKKSENSLMFRPEDFLLKQGGHSATIIESEFQGAWQKLLIELDGGPQINVFTHTMELWRQGQRITPMPRRGCVYSSEGKLLGMLA